MKYPELPLYRDKIKDAITSFAEGTTVEVCLKPNNLVMYKIKVPNEHEALLNVFNLVSGNTTLYAGVGKNTTLSDRIANHIADKCKCPTYNNKIFHLKNIKEDEYEALIEFLNHYKVEISDGKSLLYGKQYIVKHPDGGALYINRFDTGAFSVQGTSVILKSLVVEALTNLLPYEEVITMQLESYEVKATTNEVLNELKKQLPNSYGYLGDTLTTIISPSIAIATFPYELGDYSAMLYPALRGLEGYIKKLFIDNNVQEIGISFGDYFTNDPNNTEVLPKYKALIKNTKIVAAIEESYRFYREHRHSLFHVDGTIIDDTRILETKKEASEILNDVLDLIETSYSKIIK